MILLWVELPVPARKGTRRVISLDIEKSRREERSNELSSLRISADLELSSVDHIVGLRSIYESLLDSRHGFVVHLSVDGLGSVLREREEKRMVRMSVEP